MDIHVCPCVADQLKVVNTWDSHGCSPLFYAAQNGHLDCIALLLQYGADVNLATDDPVLLPLHAAVSSNQLE